MTASDTQPPNNIERWATVAEAARLLQKTPESVWDLIERGDLPARVLKVVSISDLIDYSRKIPAGELSYLRPVGSGLDAGPGGAA